MLNIILLKHAKLLIIFIAIPAFLKGWLIMIDGLGAASTNDTLTLLTTEVLMDQTSTADHLLHAMVHLVGLKECPPTVCTSNFTFVSIFVGLSNIHLMFLVPCLYLLQFFLQHKIPQFINYCTLSDLCAFVK